MISTKQIVHYLFSSTLGTLLSCGQLLGQSKAQSYVIDDEHQMIVWNVALPEEEDKTRSELKMTFAPDCSCILKVPSYTDKQTIDCKGKTYMLYLTPRPIITLNAPNPIVDSPKKEAAFTYVHNSDTLTTLTGVELRGNISLQFPKKSYDLEFWKDVTGKESVSKSVDTLRDDDDWILDGLYNEPLRLRSFFGLQLWRKMYVLPYQTEEPDAKSGIGMSFVEVAINGSYKGLYALTEGVDRKLLQLQKNQGDTVQGLLYKASSYEGGPDFTKAPKPENAFPHWAGFEMKYPVIDYSYTYDALFELNDLVVNGSSDEFRKKIASYVDIDNCINYYILVNTLRATDNLGKNYYLARYKNDRPFFFVAWDLDGTMGIIQDGKRIPTTDDVLSNGLFKRLWEENPNEYQNKVRQRWSELRESFLSTDTMLGELEKWYALFEKQKVYEREAILWPSDQMHQDHWIYLEEWLTKRLTFLDRHFSR